MNASEILDRAETLLLRDGWTQRNWTHHAQTIRHCAAGAISKAGTGRACASLTYEYHAATRRALDAFAAVIGRTDYDVPAVKAITTWNDRIVRTREQVVDAMRCAARRERAREAMQSEALESAAADLLRNTDAAHAAFVRFVAGLTKPAASYVAADVHVATPTNRPTRDPSPPPMREHEPELCA